MTNDHLTEADRELSTAIERIQDSSKIPRGLKLILEDELKLARMHVANGRTERDLTPEDVEYAIAGGDD